MDMSRTELNMDELEQVNGGWDLRKTIGGAVLGGGTGFFIGAAVAVGLSGPVGWCLAGGTLAGAAILGAVHGSEVLSK